MDVSGLGAYPLLQFFGGLIVLALSALAYYRAQINKRPEPAPMPEGTQVYLQGPLAMQIELTRELIQVARRVEDHNLVVAKELAVQSRNWEEHRKTVDRISDTLVAIERLLVEILHVKSPRR